MADIEEMFYRFLVTEDHRDFLRFFWYRNNDPKEERTHRVSYESQCVCKHTIPSCSYVWFTETSAKRRW